MNTGPATAFVGRDMNDWSVVLWYRSHTPPRFAYPGASNDEVYLVGPPGPRAQTAELLAAVVAFLRAGGGELESGDDDIEFRRV